MNGGQGNLNTNNFLPRNNSRPSKEGLFFMPDLLQMPDLRILRVQGMTIYWFRRPSQNGTFCHRTSISPVFSFKSK